MKDFIRNMWKKFSRHQQVRDRLSLYVDSLLEGEDADIVREHLQRCERCTRDVESLRATVWLLRQVPAAEPRRSFQLTEEMVSVAQPKNARPPRDKPRPVLLWATQAATAVAVVVFAFLLTTDALGTFQEEASQPGTALQTTQEDSGVATTPTPAPRVPAATTTETPPPLPAATPAPRPATESDSAALDRTEQTTEEETDSQTRIEDQKAADEQAIPATVEGDSETAIRVLEIVFGILAGALVLTTAYLYYRRRQMS